jgi:hypothetical protein
MSHEWAINMFLVELMLFGKVDELFLEKITVVPTVTAGNHE